MKVHFSRDFVSEKCCRHWDLNPQPSDLDHLAFGVSHPYGFFTSLHLSKAQDWQPQSSGGPSVHWLTAKVALVLPRLCTCQPRLRASKAAYKPQLQGPASGLQFLFIFGEYLLDGWPLAENLITLEKMSKLLNSICLFAQNFCLFFSVRV